MKNKVGKFSLRDSEETRGAFRQILLQKRFEARRNIKIKKTSTWIYPSAIERGYEKFIKSIIKRFVDITRSLKPDIAEWSRELKQIKDAFPDDLEKINEVEYEGLQNEIFIENKENLKETLFNFAILTSTFNKKQWNKTTRQALGIEFNTFENWESSMVKSWVDSNVRLIKGLTEDYVKKINYAITQGLDRGLSVFDLEKDLIRINKDFYSQRKISKKVFDIVDGKVVYRTKMVNGKKVFVKKEVIAQSRSQLIARDQITKINGQMTHQRQIDAGVDTYIWSTSIDEKVRGRPGGHYPKARPSHWIMEGRLCRWDNPNVYSPDRGATWIDRGSGEHLHPGEAIQDRCSALPNFKPLVQEINREVG